MLPVNTLNPYGHGVICKCNFYKKNAAKDRKRAKYGDRSLKKAFR